MQWCVGISSVITCPITWWSLYRNGTSLFADEELSQLLLTSPLSHQRPSDIQHLVYAIQRSVSLLEWEWVFAPCSPISSQLLQLCDCSLVVEWFICGAEVEWRDIVDLEPETSARTARLESRMVAADTLLSLDSHVSDESNTTIA